jgi:predicted thioredoxin/glutaredoxin
MTRTLSVDEFVQSTPDVLKELAASGGSFVLEDGEQVVAALVSPEDYETVRKAKAECFIDAMDAFGKHMASVATPEEIDELIRDLDTHNS